MESAIGIIGVVISMLVSLALALWLEWLSLRGLMRLMPASARYASTSIEPTAGAKESSRASSPGERN